MEELSLQELKDIELNLLKVFHSFCVENNITYFLANGSLLGAIRYKGFIPWDDDVDVLVPRDDYNRFISLFQDSEEYKLYSFPKNKKFGFPFAKLCDNATYKEETNLFHGVTLGVNIDIFPLDNWDDDFEKAKKEVAYISKYMQGLEFAKLQKAVSVNIIKQLYVGAKMAFCKMLGRGYFISKILRISCKKEQKGSRYCGCKAWCIYGEREIIPAEAFSKAIEIDFEGGKFFAPVGYDTYLTKLYGDYLPEPPPEKQKTHHCFKAYRL